MAARSLTAGSARGPSASRRRLSARRCPLVGCAAQAQDCAVAQPCAPAGAPGEEQGAPWRMGTLAGGRPSGCPLRALTPPMPGSGRWRWTAARLALCRSLAASPVSTGGNRSCPEDRPGTHAYRRLRGIAPPSENPSLVSADHPYPRLTLSGTTLRHLAKLHFAVDKNVDFYLLRLRTRAALPAH